MADQENDRLKQLCALPAEELASFIHGLSMLHDGVNESVDLFLLRKNSGELSKKIRSRIARIKRSTKFIGYRHAREMAGELNAVLNVIENDLIPLAPLQALPVLTRFIETDSSVLNRSDDSDGMIGDAYRRAIFFAETGDFLSAAEIVEQNENAFANEHYGELLDLAKRLEKNHPLAATILYRANFESILNQAKSKYYGYAASYAVKLRNLSLQIGDWKGLMPHADYWKGIQEDHKRKTAFWDRIGNTLT